MQVTKEQARAYKEVLQVLKYMSEEDLNKIPKETLNYYQQNQDSLCTFAINPSKSFTEQNLSDKAKIVLAILFRDYWASEEQREKIKQKEKMDAQKIELQKKQQYDSDILFKTDKPIQENVLVVLEKEKWYIHFIRFMKNIFSGKSK